MLGVGTRMSDFLSQSETSPASLTKEGSLCRSCEQHEPCHSHPLSRYDMTCPSMT